MRPLAGDVSEPYRFKDITKVESSADLIDNVLSKTQRKTPTVVHPQYDIRRIRSFYMRKVKFCQSTFHDKLVQIVTQFPKLDEIHPFYANLCNVLYDKDHYKLALGQVNSIKNLIDNLAKEYVRLLKYADSPYKCKMLKRAAMGRMCTAVKRLAKALTYLEEVRQHLARLPGINPFGQTLLLAGHPNVGKSTFMNVLSNANVEVADYAFTTKSPFVGHFDYAYQKWQIVDTPGILDRPLPARNSVELTAITSLAYLACAVLFLIDISGTCGNTIEEQVSLFRSLQPLLQNTPVVVCLNKIDLRRPEDLSPDEMALIDGMSENFNRIRFVAISTGEKVNLDEAKNQACDMFIEYRKQRAALAGKEYSDFRDYQPCTNVVPPAERPSFMPTKLASGECKKKIHPSDDAMEDRPLLEKEKMEALGGAGVYISDPRRFWTLENSDWLDDQIPEIFEGKNIADYVDPEIDEKLQALEEAEAAQLAAFDASVEAPTEEWLVLRAELHDANVEKAARRMIHALKKKKNVGIMPRRFIDTDEMKKVLDEYGVNSDEVLAKLHTPYFEQAMNEEDVDDLLSTDDEGDMQETKTSNPKAKAQRALLRLSLNRQPGGVGKKAREHFSAPSKLIRSTHGNEEKKEKILRSVKQTMKRYVKPKKSQTRDQINEADRFIGTAKPKHLFSGKRSIGKTDRR